MRRSLATISAALLGLAFLTPGTAARAAPAAGDLTAAERVSLAAGIGIVPKAAPGSKPKGVNPWLADVPDAGKVDYSGWASYLRAQGKSRTAARARALKTTNPSLAALAATPAVVVDEDEVDGTRGGNDVPLNGQRVKGFGTAAGQFSRIRVLGSLDSEPIITTSVTTDEDNGSIPLAEETYVGDFRTGAVVNTQLGDGPHGHTTGDGTNDFDFYRITAVPGDAVSITTATPTSYLDTVLLIYRADGTVLASNDDYGNVVDSQVKFEVDTAETLYVAVAAYRGLPGDPFDSGSGDGLSYTPSEGAYTLTITENAIDRDYFAIPLRAGDVLGASVKGSAANLTVYDTVPREAHGSDQDASAVYPMASPLPGGGTAVTDFVATRTGWHYVGVTVGTGAYDATVEAYRPVLEGATPAQTLFLDFDGARVNTGVFGGYGNRDLSPLAAFLGSWGLTRADEDALTDAVVAAVRENLATDLAAGPNPNFRLEVRNSKDDEDTFGQPNVSRIVVGGTIDESGVDTIGIAQSIDPGNFESEETALVLLDVLSAEPGVWDASLNNFLTPQSDRIAFVGRALGNVIAHEAGHLFGDFHTDNSDAVANLMDAGGLSPELLFGVGPDGIGGTADDVDVDFVPGPFQPTEGFTGIQDTAGRIAFGVTS